MTVLSTVGFSLSVVAHPPAKNDTMNNTPNEIPHTFFMNLLLSDTLLSKPDKK